MPGASPVPYREITKDAYAEHAARTFSTDLAAGMVTLRGPCARCGHFMEFLIGDVVRQWPRPRRAVPDPAAAVGQQVQHMICTCGGEHPGQPEGFTGCGAYWDLAVSVAP